jgi:type I restriction-modification system DNA methylase subunit
MTARPLELFYSYAREDETLRNQLDRHLAMLKRQGLIREWYDRDISAGRLWVQQIDEHLKSADIILLLISSAFIASDYCYGVEMQQALRRHDAGEARVVPIILRSCDWKAAPFGKLQALPRDARPVTRWKDRDEAFTDVAQGIRRVIAEMNGTAYDTEESEPRQSAKTRKRADNRMEEETAGTIDRCAPVRTINRRAHDEIDAYNTTLEAERVSAALNAALKRAIERYYKELKEYEGKARHELALRTAFEHLLAEGARTVKLTLIPEQTIDGNIRPDGVLLDSYKLRRGYWEAKGPDSDLDAEIKKKISAGYPLINTIFENTRKAVLYQNKKRFPYVFDLSKASDVRDLLSQFLTHVEPEVENFEAAVSEFKERIPEHAQALLRIIEDEYKRNSKFIHAFNEFKTLCISALDPNIKDETIKEMLVQHLLSERLFRTVFDNPDFVRRNVVAAKIEEVIDALTSRAFNRHDFLKSLDRFYVAIESAAKSNGGWLERQHFLNTVYERFFQGYAAKQADVLGTVYTPQEIVDFMVASVDEVLKREFGKSMSEPGVQILDPATGTGSFIVNIIDRIKTREQLRYKYQHDLFCNEVALLPYYIASLNIEHEYFARMKEYVPFEGICFADTLELAEGQQLPLFVEENTERVQREKDAQIMVVIGNPPYNVGQKSENENNRNRPYKVVDQRINETYVKDSRASNRNKLYDAYIRFFRWAADRLGKSDGVICLVSNNGFLTGIGFDGFRKRSSEEFTHIYHVDLGGDSRKGSDSNVFGIRVGVGITLLIRKKVEQGSKKRAAIYYYRLPDDLSKSDKLAWLQRCSTGEIAVPWQELVPNGKQDWITEGLHTDHFSFMPLGTREGKRARAFEAGGAQAPSIFKDYSLGVNTNRDQWMYDFHAGRLASKASSMIDTYNAELARWVRAGCPENVDDFVTPDETRIKWSSRLKECLRRKIDAQFDPRAIRNALYRPFTRRFLYFDHIMTHRQGQFPSIFPTVDTENDNVIICVPGPGNRVRFGCLAAHCITDLDLAFEKVQCFPYYTYTEDGSNRRENITDWALRQFQDRYGPDVSKWDIFHYVYGLLHHPQYRERYKENLKRDLPHIPLLHSRVAFDVCKNIGQRLMYLHLHYEQEKEYPLREIEDESVPYSRVVEKMKLSPDCASLKINDALTLAGIPQECFQYKLGNRSALEWVIDQYQVTRDRRSGIESDPNRIDDEGYIVRLVKQVVTVSVETVKLVDELTRAVTAEDWLEATPSI